MYGKLLSRKEVAEMLGISLVTLYHHNKKGILKPTHKIGRKPLYDFDYVMSTIALTDVKPLSHES